MRLRPATPADLALLQHWDEQPHVVESDPNDDWHWEIELERTPPWREQLIAELDGRPIGFLQIIDPALEESHYWGAASLRRGRLLRPSPRAHDERGAIAARPHQTRRFHLVPRKITPFLMFQGRAEEAMRFYVTLFPGSEIRELERWGAGEPGPEGSLKRALLTVAGQEVICFESPVKHAFSFTPSFSFFVECESEAELDDAFARLSDGGAVLMPLGDHGFSRKFGWINDRFGVSWQLNLD